MGRKRRNRDEVLRYTNYATELGHKCKHVRYHIIRLIGYRAVVSSDAFFHGMRAHKQHKARGQLWPSHGDAEHDEYTVKRHHDIIPGGISNWRDDVPVVEHDSIWDFYKYVGYNYKTRKWTGDKNEQTV